MDRKESRWMEWLKEVKTGLILFGMGGLFTDLSQEWFVAPMVEEFFGGKWQVETTVLCLAFYILGIFMSAAGLVRIAMDTGRENSSVKGKLSWLIAALSIQVIGSGGYAAVIGGVGTLLQSVLSWEAETIRLTVDILAGIGAVFLRAWFLGITAAMMVQERFTCRVKKAVFIRLFCVEAVFKLIGTGILPSKNPLLDIIRIILWTTGWMVTVGYAFYLTDREA